MNSVDILASIAIVGLSSFAFAYLLKYTDGPYYIFSKFRHMVGLQDIPVLDSYGNVMDYREESDGRFFAELISCFWCISTWIAFIGTLLSLLIGTQLLAFPFVWFGAVGVAGLIYKIVEG